MQPRARRSSLRDFPTTTGLLVVIGLVFLAELAGGAGTSSAVLEHMGAMYAPLVLKGQVWRLLSAAFLHAGVVHIAMNGMALWQLGRLCELTFGKIATLWLFVLTAITGSLVSVGLLLAIGPPTFVPHPSVGASGALFGFEGALIAFFLRHRERLTQVGSALLRQLLGWAVGMMVFSFVIPGIDWTAHLGGLIGGLAVGWAIPQYRAPTLGAPSGA